MNQRYVIIPFLEKFRQPMLAGVKIYTARSRRMGKRFDRFQAFGAEFEIEHVSRQPLGYVASLWEGEGCRSAKDFISTYNSLHPRKPYAFHNKVWLHQFKRIDHVA